MLVVLELHCPDLLPGGVYELLSDDVGLDHEEGEDDNEEDGVEEGAGAGRVGRGSHRGYKLQNAEECP